MTIPGSDALSAINPRTGQADHAIPRPDAAQIRALAARLRAAQPAWADAPLSHRQHVLRDFAAALERHRGAIARAEGQDTGRSRIPWEGIGAVIGGLRAWSDAAPSIIARAQAAGRSTVMPTVTYRNVMTPYPLLGVISPWNFPFLLSMIDAIPALVAGCAAIIKPSEVTPRFIAPLMACIQEVPEIAAVLAYVVGDGHAGQSIVDCADVVCFTGSVATGRKVAEACARRFIPVFLELGGKDPVIVTASADLDRAAKAVLRGAAFATGQICYSVERVYVERSVHDAFVSRLVEQAGAIDLTFPDARQGHLGPFIFARQAAIVDAQLEEAVSRGAVIHTGGQSQNLGGGRYMRPTVVTRVTHDMAVMREETFGPVIPVMPYDTEEEAIGLANDTNLGLSAAVIAGSSEEAARIGARLNAGAISLQDTILNGAILRDAEMQAFNFSGLGGSRMGPAALLRFLRKKALIEQTGPVVDLRDLREPGDADEWT